MVPKVWEVAVVSLFLLVPSQAASIVLNGTVVMEDGSVPSSTVRIERLCSETGVSRETQTDRKGQFGWRMEIDPLNYRSCVLRASLAGYDSTAIDLADFNFSSNPNLTTLVLARQGARTVDTDTNVFYQEGVPLAVRQIWNSVDRSIKAKNWPVAETQLRVVVRTAPKFAAGWNALGLVFLNQNKLPDAKEAFQRSIESDAKLLEAYLSLARVTIGLRDWNGVVKAAENLIQHDTKQSFSEIYVHLAIAQFELNNPVGAVESIHTAIGFDKRHEFPQSEDILRIILESTNDYDGAREHLTRYFDPEPRTRDGAPITPVAELMRVAPAAAPTDEIWVPGGLKALAAIAHLNTVPIHANFYSEYCRSIVNESQVGTASFAQYRPTLLAFMDSVSKLASEGERHGDRTAIVLSLSTAEQRKKTERVLPLLGWKLVEGNEGSFGVEPGDRATDGLLQSIPAALGIDEIGMQETLETGKDFQFEIVSENAPLVGFAAWIDLVRNADLPRGGLAAAFAGDVHKAKVCAGLSSMGAELAGDLMSAVGLRNLVAKYSNDLGRHAEAFVLSKGAVVVPGGPEADAVWKNLVGANPRDPAAFLRGLIVQPERRLAAFYHAVSRGDKAHQQFFTKTAKRAERFLAWYQHGDEFANGEVGQVDGWRTEFFRMLPLDDSGNVRYPGGKRAWTSSSSPDDDGLPDMAWLEALLPVTGLDQQRKTRLDENSARLLAQHYAEWRSLFPYFTKLTALGAGEFTALAAFEKTALRYPAATRNIVMGEWNSMVELIAQGVQSGHLDASAGARWFRAVCEGLAGPNHSARALEILGEMTGGTDLNEGVPNNLLRLSAARRSSFDRVLEMLKAPRLRESPKASSPAATAMALSALVYAVTLDPDTLLVGNDPQLLRKHRFVPVAADQKQASLFSASALVKLGGTSGSYLAGGFPNFEEVVRGLVRGETPASEALPSDGEEFPRQGPPAPAPPQAEDLSTAATFSVRKLAVSVDHLVVTDRKGGYVDELTAGQFTILDEGRPQEIRSFESQFSKVSVALVLDTTGSMQDTLPALKNAALRLIGYLRSGDSVAVYKFSENVTRIQSFTSDTAAAKRAVMRTYAGGDTAIYDALVRVSQDLAGQTGKKVIILFTDGDDNKSTLTAKAALQTAKTIGVPIYTIAQGEALQHVAYLKVLEGVSKATGGMSFSIHRPSEIAAVFERVSNELTHGYYLSFEPEGVESNTCHAVQIQVGASKGYKVRAREGYCAQ